MRKLLVGSTLLLAVGLISSASAMPARYPAMRDARADLIEVKGGHGWGHGHAYRPFGWSRGRKVGWRGYGCPPGLWKKGWC